MPLSRSEQGARGAFTENNARRAAKRAKSGNMTYNEAAGITTFEAVEEAKRRGYDAELLGSTVRKISRYVGDVEREDIEESTNRFLADMRRDGPTQ